MDEHVWISVCIYFVRVLPLSMFVADLSRSSTVYTSLGVKLRRRKTVFAETHGSMIANEPLMETNTSILSISSLSTRFYPNSMDTFSISLSWLTKSGYGVNGKTLRTHGVAMIGMDGQLEYLFKARKRVCKSLQTAEAVGAITVEDAQTSVQRLQEETLGARNCTTASPILNFCFTLDKVGLLEYSRSVTQNIEL
jgi:hypothetical protein